MALSAKKFEMIISGGWASRAQRDRTENERMRLRPDDRHRRKPVTHIINSKQGNDNTMNGRICKQRHEAVGRVWRVRGWQDPLIHHLTRLTRKG